MTTQDDRVVETLRLLDRHEKWPIDDEVRGFVPIDEVRSMLTGIPEDA